MTGNFFMLRLVRRYYISSKGHRSRTTPPSSIWGLSGGKRGWMQCRKPGGRLRKGVGSELLSSMMMMMMACEHLWNELKMFSEVLDV